MKTPKTPGQWALYYGTVLDWSIFPVKPRLKSPAIDNWQARSTTDREQIERWWKQRPNANIGLDCGKSGITVVDVDNKNGKNGEETLMLLELDIGALPSSIRSMTPTGGMHIFLKGAARSSQSKLGLGLDTRGKGGLVLLPGSRTDDGEYRWL